MSRVGLVVNPVGDPDRADELAELLKRDHDVRTLETTEDDPGTAMATDFREDGCEVVIACGGDGTVRAAAEALVGTDVDLVVLPGGTGNLLALNLQLPSDVREVADLVAGNRVDRIDVGYANDEAFLIMAGAGLDTTVMEETARSLKDTLGPAAYALTALSHLADEPFDIELTVNGGRTDRMSVATVLVGNMGRVLKPVDLFPDADWTDGRFDVLAITADSLASWVSAAREALGDPGDYVRRFGARRLTIGFDAPRTYQLDGDERPSAGSIDIRIEQRALNVRRSR